MEEGRTGQRISVNRLGYWHLSLPNIFSNLLYCKFHLNAYQRENLVDESVNIGCSYCPFQEFFQHFHLLYLDHPTFHLEILHQSPQIPRRNLLVFHHFALVPLPMPVAATY